MNTNINESLEDLRIRLELDALTESELYPVLAAAMEDCGVENLAPSLEELIEQAAELVEKGPPPAAASKSDKVKKGMKMVFGVLRRVAHPLAKVVAWGAGRALQGAGHVVKELGKGLGDKGAQMNWQPKKKRTEAVRIRPGEKMVFGVPRKVKMERGKLVKADPKKAIAARTAYLRNKSNAIADKHAAMRRKEMNK